MTCATEQATQFRWQVLAELEFHAAAVSGVATTRSRARSAAYAMAAVTEMSSRFARFLAKRHGEFNLHKRWIWALSGAGWVPGKRGLHLPVRETRVSLETLNPPTGKWIYESAKRDRANGR